MSHVLVIYSGGTIGCSGRPLRPMPGQELEQLLLSQPALKDHRLAGYDIDYALDFQTAPLDSSNMTPRDWVRLARTILDAYEGYDGFVVLHGTDTMSWTSSALSFLLPGLSKPVIVTGSQLPLVAPLSDAPRNLLTALAIAGTARLPEVCLFFNTVLLRGNRAVKVHATDFSAFASPNFPCLGRAGIDLDFDVRLIRATPEPDLLLERPENLRKTRRDLERLERAVAEASVVALALFPGMPPSMLEALFRGTVPPVRGVVLQAFGEGNAPSNPEFLQTLRRAHDAGVVLVDGTQVLAGKVDFFAYETGQGLREVGAVSARDLTPEAALTKLVYLIALGHDPAEVEHLMLLDLAGEIGPP